MRKTKCFLFIFLIYSGCTKYTIPEFNYVLQNSTSSKLGVTFYKNSILVKTVELDLKEEYATTYVNKTETAAIGEYIFKADSLVISRLGSSIFYIDCKKGGDCAKRTPFSFISYKNIDDKSFIYSITDADFK